MRIIILSVLIASLAAPAFALTVQAPTTFPGRARFYLMDAGSAGKRGQLAFAFKPAANLANLRAEVVVPKGMAIDPAKRVGVFTRLHKGRAKRWRIPFEATKQGLFRVKLKVHATTPSGKRYNDFYTALVEAGSTRLYGPKYLPRNNWQKVSIIKGATVYEYDRTPRMPTVGRVKGKLAFSAPPALNRPVTVGFKVVSKERLPRRGKAELVLRLPPNAFDVLRVAYPQGGKGSASGNEIKWIGPASRQSFFLRAKIRARTTGWGEIRGFFKARKRGRLIVTETPLKLQVNEHSAQIVTRPKI